MVNKVLIQGRAGADAEVGQNIVRFSVCTDDGYYDKDKSEWVSKDNWHSISCFGYQMKQGEKVKKGDLVFISGKVTYSKVEDKYYTNIVADQVRVIVKREESPIATKQPIIATKGVIEDGLPF